MACVRTAFDGKTSKKQANFLIICRTTRKKEKAREKKKKKKQKAGVE